MEHCTEQQSTEKLQMSDKNDVVNINNTAADDDNVDHSAANSTDASTADQVSTPTTTPTPEKKGRGSGRKRRSNADMFAEAKATCGGDIDMSEGRRLRKRPEPPKVEKTPPARKPQSRKSKTPTGKQADVKVVCAEETNGVAHGDSNAAESSDDGAVQSVPAENESTPVDSESTPVENDNVKTQASEMITNNSDDGVTEQTSAMDEVSHTAESLAPST